MRNRLRQSTAPQLGQSRRCQPLFSSDFTCARAHRRAPPTIRCGPPRPLRRAAGYAGQIGDPSRRAALSVALVAARTRIDPRAVLSPRSARRTPPDGPAPRLATRRRRAQPRSLVLSYLGAPALREWPIRCSVRCSIRCSVRCHCRSVRPNPATGPACTQDTRRPGITVGSPSRPRWRPPSGSPRAA